MIADFNILCRQSKVVEVIEKKGASQDTFQVHRIV